MENETVVNAQNCMIQCRGKVNYSLKIMKLCTEFLMLQETAKQIHKISVPLLLSNKLPLL